MKVWSDNKEEITPDMIRNQYIKVNKTKIENLINHAIQIINKTLSKDKSQLILDGYIDIYQSSIFPKRSFIKEEINLGYNWKFIKKAVQDTFTSWIVESNYGSNYYFRFRPKTPFDNTLEEKSEEEKEPNCSEVEIVVRDSPVENRSELLDLGE